MKKFATKVVLQVLNFNLDIASSSTPFCKTGTKNYFELLGLNTYFLLCHYFICDKKKYGQYFVP